MVPLKTLALAAATASFTGGATAEVTLINAFEVPEGREAEVIAAWEAAHDFLSRQEGYIDTRLHRALGPEARFTLVNLARWESPAAFRTAAEKMRRRASFPGSRGWASIPRSTRSSATIPGRPGSDAPDPAVRDMAR